MADPTSLYGGYLKASRYSSITDKALERALKPYKISLASLRRKKSPTDTNRDRRSAQRNRTGRLGRQAKLDSRTPDSVLRKQAAAAVVTRFRGVQLKKKNANKSGGRGTVPTGTPDRRPGYRAF